jgi:hypothetical protein
MDPKGAGSELQETRGAAPLHLRSLRLLAALALAGAVTGPRALAAAPATAQPLGYARDIAPLFERWCVPCHGEHEVQGGLRLDSFEDALRGGDAGPVIVPGDPAASLLVAKIERRHRPSMPPRRRLPAAAAARIRAWIAAGTSR